jgi:hypothetical protein
MKQSITELSWVALNEALKHCTDEAELQRWLNTTLLSNHPARATRCLRIYGRLTVVRRMHEMQDLKRRLKEAA